MLSALRSPLYAHIGVSSPGRKAHLQEAQCFNHIQSECRQLGCHHNFRAYSGHALSKPDECRSLKWVQQCAAHDRDNLLQETVVVVVFQSNKFGFAQMLA